MTLLYMASQHRTSDTSILAWQGWLAHTMEQVKLFQSKLNTCRGCIGPNRRTGRQEFKVEESNLALFYLQSRPIIQKRSEAVRPRYLYTVANHQPWTDVV
jgi:hypothetical protein